MHFRLMYPSEYLSAADIEGKEASCTIAKVEMENVPGVDGQKKSKPVVSFSGKQKRFPLPKTCAKVIAAAFGPHTEDWIGKKIILYPTTCQAFGQTVECVRVRIP